MASGLQLPRARSKAGGAAPCRQFAPRRPPVHTCASCLEVYTANISFWIHILPDNIKLSPSSSIWIFYTDALVTPQQLPLNHAQALAVASQCLEQQLLAPQLCEPRQSLPQCSSMSKGNGCCVFCRRLHRRRVGLALLGGRHPPAPVAARRPCPPNAPAAAAAQLSNCRPCRQRRISAAGFASFRRWPEQSVAFGPGEPTRLSLLFLVNNCPCCPGLQLADALSVVALPWILLNIAVLTAAGGTAGREPEPVAAAPRRAACPAAAQHQQPSRNARCAERE